MITLLIMLIIISIIILKFINKEKFTNNDTFKILNKCFENINFHENVFFTKYRDYTKCVNYNNNIACYTPLKVIDEINIKNSENGLLIHNVCVDPKLRNQGNATKLLNIIFDIAKNELKKKFCYIQVKISNEPAVNLYKKLGFTNIIDHPTHYNMIKDLV